MTSHVVWPSLIFFFAIKDTYTHTCGCLATSLLCQHDKKIQSRIVFPLLSPPPEQVSEKPIAQRSIGAVSLNM